LRDTIRQAVEFDGLTEQSQVEFSGVITSMISRIVVGPPIQRGAELLSLIDAGIVQVPFGPSPIVQHQAGSGEWLVASSALDQPTRRTVTAIVAGYLDAPTVDRSRSPLLCSLLAAGRIRASKRNSDGTGIDVDRDGRPLNRLGQPEQGLTVLGPLCEGSRYFSHYVPSPKSRFRAFLDAATAVAALLERHRAPLLRHRGTAATLARKSRQ
jgi:uncharacterized NAD(P)/FAD-binding protein YdhS